MTELTKNEIISYLQEELEAARRDMLAAQGNSDTLIRTAAESSYGTLSLICNDLGIAGPT